MINEQNYSRSELVGKSVCLYTHKNLISYNCQVIASTDTYFVVEKFDSDNKTLGFETHSYKDVTVKVKDTQTIKPWVGFSNDGKGTIETGIHIPCPKHLDDEDGTSFIDVGVQIGHNPDEPPHFCIVSHVGEMSEDEATPVRLLHLLAAMLGYNLTKKKI